jgi:hypothetical protein
MIQSSIAEEANAQADTSHQLYALLSVGGTLVHISLKVCKDPYNPGTEKLRYYE